VYTTNEESSLSSVVKDDVIVKSNKIYSVSGSFGKMDLSYAGDRFVYESSAQLLSVNGEVEGLPFNYSFVKPSTGTTFVIGGNPYAGAGADTQLKGTVYCVRIYDRALTEEEIKENYEIDKKKYGIE
jgi:hypothetical protein